MACCTTSLPYFMTTDRDQYCSVNCDTDDQLMYDSADDSHSSLWRKCLTLFTVPDPALSSDDTSPLLHDCMWSAGMLPPDLKAATPPASSVNHDCVSVTDVDVGADTAVDPSLISPCPHLTSSPRARHVTDPGTQCSSLYLTLTYTS